ncbi:hypothetical protein A8709_13095 [Paenibacillus pectinilyticus]|uniref:HAMP domain-containing protein n=1 Tax=Paenibacillus pectinilyticus TaxID=512399 RepID=A0A1C1A3C3_9BACL|nr:sensor histidine kinase [Paenibacillus pectinilyticus]OCT15048.1 hypothetical protein A8709_13095 [Paenibacillus pectinilyticus]
MGDEMAFLIQFSKLSPTRKRIIMICVLLSIVVQLVLVFTGLAYLNNMNDIIQEKNKNNVINQFYKNTLTQLGAINDLFQLMQTPDFSSFFRASMNVRDERTVTIKKEELLSKMNALLLSPQMVQRIYFIGSDSNQVSYYKDTTNNQFNEMRDIRMDMLQAIKLSPLFLQDNNRLTKYLPKELQVDQIDKLNIVNKETAAEIDTFKQDIANKLILSNGNINGVLIIIVLNPDFIGNGLPQNQSMGNQFSIVNGKQQEIWTYPSKDGMQTCEGCEQITKKLTPYPYSVVFTRHTSSLEMRNTPLLDMFIIMFIFIIILTLIISIYYSKKLFNPYYALSSKMKEQTRTNELVLKSIAVDWLKKGFHTISLRNNLIILFSFVVILPTISGGVLYSYYYNKTVQNQIDSSLSEIGKYTALTFQNQVNYLQNLINQLSVSEQLQQYLTTRQVLESFTSYTAATPDSISISMFPGLNEVNYFVLFEPTGKSMYSSILSNNLDIFKIDPEMLKNQQRPYWISDYTDIYGQTTMALLKKVQFVHNGLLTESYLLLVPKTSIFDEISPIDSKLIIDDGNMKSIFTFDHLSTERMDHTVTWSNAIPDTEWTLHLQFSNEEIIYKNRQYYYSFLFTILLILILSIIIAYVISSFLIKPIEQLKRTMVLVGEGDISHRVNYQGKNEIGEIIQSYNFMIEQLNQVIQENVNNKVRENKLLALKTEAELRMLQAQINPHFLYNTLEAINMRSLRDGKNEISRIVGALSDLFRYSISEGTGMESLEKELNHVHNYISIQKIRFGEQFTFEVNVPDHLTKYLVVKLILQPIVENCLKHGLSGFEEGGFVGIRITELEGTMCIEVTDNGIGMDKETVVQVNHEIQRSLEDQLDHGEVKGGIGLRNVYQRLQMFYQDDASMDISSSPMKGTKVTMKIPLKTNVNRTS